jgi:hypothetical protein
MMEKDESLVAVPDDPILQPTIEGDSALDRGMPTGHRG